MRSACFHKPGGAEHARWMLDYRASGHEDGEAGYRFGVRTFATGRHHPPICA
jgi:hypothetical protein